MLVVISVKRKERLKSNQTEKHKVGCQISSKQTREENNKNNKGGKKKNITDVEISAAETLKIEKG